MASISGLTRLLRGLATLPNEVAALREEVAAVREKVNEASHVILTLVPAIHHTVALLSHDVHAGSEEALPLFVGYAERLRLDADTAIGAAQVIERQLSELEHTIATLRRDG